MKSKLISMMLAIVCVALFSTISFAQTCTEEGSIQSVKKSQTLKFETVAFVVNSKSPDYTITSARPPFKESGSGKKIKINGKYYKSIRFTDVMWTCQIFERLADFTTSIAAVKKIEQYEGNVEYIIGFRKSWSYAGSTESRMGGKTNIVLKFRRS